MDQGGDFLAEGIGDGRRTEADVGRRAADETAECDTADDRTPLPGGQAQGLPVVRSRGAIGMTLPWYGWETRTDSETRR